jgi:hypothetical protein
LTAAPVGEADVVPARDELAEVRWASAAEVEDIMDDAYKLVREYLWRPRGRP